MVAIKTKMTTVAIRNIEKRYGFGATTDGRSFALQLRCSGSCSGFLVSVRIPVIA